MMEVTVDVEATVGSRVAPNHEPETASRRRAGHPVLDCYPVGEGFVRDSLAPDRKPRPGYLETGLPGKWRPVTDFAQSARQWGRPSDHRSSALGGVRSGG